MSYGIFAVSHRQDLLDLLPEDEHINKVLLEDLAIPIELQGEELAENRFLLTNKLIERKHSHVGFISARWDDRFSTWPKLADLGKVFDQIQNLPKHFFFAPNAFLVSSYQISKWLQRQQKVHPGMLSLLEDLIDFHKIDYKDGSLHTIVMGNNFGLSHEAAVDFLSFWQDSFDYLHAKHGLNFDFSYRCPNCGFESSEGIGRYSRSRHSGFLLERVTSLFFISRPDLLPLTWNGSSVVESKPIKVSRHVGIGLELIQPYRRLKSLLTSCRKQHLIDNKSR
jgi:hypothetical protein